MVEKAKHMLLRSQLFSPTFFFFIIYISFTHFSITLSHIYIHEYIQILFTWVFDIGFRIEDSLFLVDSFGSPYFYGRERRDAFKW